MPDYPAKMREIVALFEGIEDRAERMELLISFAGKFREVPADVATRPFPHENRAPHCESRAYVWARRRDDEGFIFHFAVENPQGMSAKAMAAILATGLEGAGAEEILAVPDDLAIRLFGDDLSMGKNMGLTGMLQMIKAFARRAQ